MGSLWQDIRYSLRVLAKARGFTVFAILTLAVSLGTCIAVFSLINAVLLRALPYPEAERIFEVSILRPPSESKPGGKAYLPTDIFDLWRKNTRAAEHLAAYRRQQYTLSSPGKPERLNGASVSPSIFSLLRVPPSVGRVLLEQEELPGFEHVVVLSHGFWRRRFDGDPEIVGKDLTLDGKRHTVVGVMPERFFFPEREADLWTPLVVTHAAPSSETVVSVQYLPVLVRLKDGVTLEQGKTEARTILGNLRQREALSVAEIPAGEVRLASLREEMTREARPALLAMLSAVGVVLLIACANLANLLLARGVSRQQEMAIRAAVGGGKARLVRQVLTESVVLSLAGGIVGLLAAHYAHEPFLRLLPADIPRSDEMQVDAFVFLFALTIAGLAGLVFGLAPALRSTPRDPAVALHGELLERPEGKNFRRILVLAEVALATVLLVGGALLLRSFQRLMDIDPGYEPGNVLTTLLDLQSSRYQAPGASEVLFDELLERLATHPDVKASGVVSFLPLTSFFSLVSLEVADQPGRSVRACPQLTNPEYFQAMRMKLSEGRWLTGQDRAAAIPEAMVNEAFVRKYLGAGPVVGQRLRRESAELEIIGVVRDSRLLGLDSEPRPTFFTSYWHSKTVLGSSPRRLSLAIQTVEDPTAIVPFLRSLVLDIDPELPLQDVMAMKDRLSASVALPRFYMFLLGFFAVIALGLAFSGIYGTLSFFVSRQYREIGIRRALGAQQGDIIKMVFKEGFAVIVGGLLIGLVAAAAGTRVLAHLLFEITAMDPVAYVAAPLLLGGAAALACYLPARWATRVEPIVVIRRE